MNTSHPKSLPYAAAMLCVLLAGCASSPASNPFDGAPGVVGSMAQARSSSDRSAGSRAAEDVLRGTPQQSPQASANSEASRAALKAAEDAYANGEWVQAAQLFQGLTNSYPTNGQLWFGYGAASALAGNLEEAARGFEGALRIDGTDPRAAYNLSLVRLSQADITLNLAYQYGARAPASVRDEISHLRKDLAPLFGRTSRAATAGMTQAPALHNPVPRAPMRIQDPARAQSGEAAPQPRSGGSGQP